MSATSYVSPVLAGREHRLLFWSKAIYQGVNRLITYVADNYQYGLPITFYR
ncbi:MAG: hypothetical protein JO025_02075 [Verrucomicrobia bacterium]|nr:hypothetical protein [Verrucomicrobiota bacterium]